MATTRALDLKAIPDPVLTEQGFERLRNYLRDLGHAPLSHGTPDGYPDFADPWLSSGGTMARWNSAKSLSMGDNPGFTKPDYTNALAGATTYGQALDQLSVGLLQQKLTSDWATTVLEFLGKTATEPFLPVDTNFEKQAAGLLLSAPPHQLR